MSHFSRLTTHDQNTEELRFTVAGPTGIRGEMAVTIPVFLLAAPYTVTVDGQVVTASTDGQVVSFGYTYAGSREIVIKRG